MRLIDGKKISEKLAKELKREVKKLKKKPKLAVVLVGSDPASRLYVDLKEKKCGEVGLDFEKYVLPLSVSEKEVVALVKTLNAEEAVDGIIVQLPLPSFMNPEKIINAIDARKDVDGFTEKNRKNLLSGKEPVLKPVLPHAFLTALLSEKIDLRDKKVGAVVNSEIFGRVLKAVFEKNGAKCDYLVKRVCLDKGLDEFLKNADIIISMTGCPGMIKGNMLKDGVVALDAGIARADNKILGDVDLESVKSKASLVTPTPGGIGPITVITLLWNVYLASRKWQLND